MIRQGKILNLTAGCGLRAEFGLMSVCPIYFTAINGGIMKKVLFIAAIMGALLLCGCSAKPEGYDSIKKAKELFEELDSARVIMEDVSAGEQLMEFSFYINKDDEMIFSYRGRGAVNEDGGSGEEYGYSNGAEFYYKTAGTQTWEVIGPADENYYYNIYTRDYRYPYARGSIFFLDGTSVESVSMTEAQGGTEIVYTYAPEKLNSYAVGLLDNVSSFSELTATYLIDENGYIREFSEKGIVTDIDGNESSVDLRITVDKMNEIYEIEAPVNNSPEDKQ